MNTVSDKNRLDEYATITREMIARENDLINNRMNWLSGLTGLLFTALGFVWGKASGLEPIIAIVGLILSFSSFWILFGANLSYRRLYAEWDKKKRAWEQQTNEQYDFPNVVAVPPMPSWSLLDLIVPWLSVPMVLVAVWTVLLVRYWLGLWP